MTEASIIARPVSAPAVCRPPARAWARLAAVHARAFAREPSTRAILPVPAVACCVLWLVSVGMLAAGLGRAEPSGRAVAFVWPSRPTASQLLRAVAVGSTGAAGLFAVVAAAGASGSWPGYGMLFLLAVLALPAARACLSGRAGRARLRRARPGQPHWVVSGVCRDWGAPGAGAALLSGIARAADRAGMPLALDAVAPRLVAYYTSFGFAPTGPAELLPGGAVVTPLVRHPKGRPHA